MPDRSPNEAFRATQEKLERLKERYSVKKIRECDWIKKKQQEPSIKWVNLLEPREAKPTRRVPLIVIIVMTLIIALTVHWFPQRSRAINVISPKVNDANKLTEGPNGQRVRIKKRFISPKGKSTLTNWQKVPKGNPLMGKGSRGVRIKKNHLSILQKVPKGKSTLINWQKIP